MLRLFDAVGGNAFGEERSSVFPPMNITQDNDNYYVRAEVPGVVAKDLEVSALGRRLTITGKREIPKENDKVSYHRKERAGGEFSRTVTLPTDIDAAKVSAECKSGILNVTLPKSETAKPRQISVKSSS